MCGIVGYTGHREASRVLVPALRLLEYRGYDSFGLATLHASIDVLKRKGKIAEGAQEALLPRGKTGIGHTRWATHGEPSDRNAHPQLDCHGRIAVVHNGIISNYAALKQELLAKGHAFASDTDTEVIAHLLEEYYRGDLLSALQETTGRLEGTYAILALAEGDGRIVAARWKSPLVLGLGDRENLAASDVVPLLEYTSRVIFLRDGDLATLSPDGITILNQGVAVGREVETIAWQPAQARKGGYRHYMEKEIFEQPIAFYETARALDREVLHSLFSGEREITLVACGTSYHAALAGRHLLESYCRLPVRVELASEFVLSPLSPRGTVLAVSQSGETADTLAAVERASRANARVIAITNVQGSTLCRMADHAIYTRAGPEIAVAATKSHVSQLAVFMAIAAALSGDPDLERALSTAHRAIERALRQDLGEAVERCIPASSLLYIGRGIYHTAAMEGALKMKEISYIHAEAFAAGELKHGPLALLSPTTPVIAICACDRTHDAMLSSMKEVKARGAPLIALGDAGDREVEGVADLHIPLSCTHPFHRLLQVTVVLQLLAYRTALALGREIDQPRHLAKSVTVG